jgi:hypothetical protein
MFSGLDLCRPCLAFRRNDHLGNRPATRRCTVGFVMKKFINRPEDVVKEMMQGLAVLHSRSTRKVRVARHTGNRA